MRTSIRILLNGLEVEKSSDFKRFFADLKIEFEPADS